MVLLAALMINKSNCLIVWLANCNGIRTLKITIVPWLVLFQIFFHKVDQRMDNFDVDLLYSIRVIAVGSPDFDIT